MKQLERSMETHKVYRCSIYAPLVTLQTSTQFSNSSHVPARRLLWPVKFAVEALEGTVASEVGILGLSHILPYLEVAWGKVRESREAMNGSCSSCPSLLQLRCFYYLIVIEVPFTAGTL